jgi:hypothetical protein
MAARRVSQVHMRAASGYYVGLQSYVQELLAITPCDSAPGATLYMGLAVKPLLTLPSVRALKTRRTLVRWTGRKKVPIFAVKADLVPPLLRSSKLCTANPLEESEQLQTRWNLISTNMVTKSLNMQAG